jgi:hypothetical protein
VASEGLFFCGICGFSRSLTSGSSGSSGSGTVDSGNGRSGNRNGNRSSGDEGVSEGTVRCCRCLVQVHASCLQLIGTATPVSAGESESGSVAGSGSGSGSRAVAVAGLVTGAMPGLGLGVGASVGVGSSGLDWTCSCCTSKIEEHGLSKNASMFSKKVERAYSCMFCNTGALRRCRRQLYMRKIQCGLWVSRGV